MDTVVTKKLCGRCGGTGRYSFNLIDGDVCYGCGGTGYVAMAPKGQKKIKPTAELRDSIVGDIVMNAKVLYRVDRIVWIKTRISGFNWHNQKVLVTRLIDEKKFAIYRGKGRESPDSLSTSIDPITGKKTHKFGLMQTDTTPGHLIGTDVEPDFWKMTEQERQEGIASWVARGYNAEDFE